MDIRVSCPGCGQWWRLAEPAERLRVWPSGHGRIVCPQCELPVDFEVPGSAMTIRAERRAS